MHATQSPQEAIVHLGAFEGPMDLLLYLIRRAEVDITDIPISEITDQYLERLKGIERIDIDLAGEFLVMAATLMEIKSRMISPAPEADGAETREPRPDAGDAPSADPRADLVRQLLEYKRVRDSAQALESRRDEWERRRPAAAVAAPAPSEAPADHDLPADIDADDLNLYDLVEAFARIIETVDIDRAVRGAHEVAYDDTPIELHAEDVLDRLRRAAAASPASAAEPLPLRDLLAGRTRVEMVGLFLAVLELIRRRSVVVACDAGEREYTVALNTDPEPAA